VNALLYPQFICEDKEKSDDGKKGSQRPKTSDPTQYNFTDEEVDYESNSPFMEVYPDSKELREILADCVTPSSYSGSQESAEFVVDFRNLPETGSPDYSTSPRSQAELDVYIRNNVNQAVLEGQLPSQEAADFYAEVLRGMCKFVGPDKGNR